MNYKNLRKRLTKLLNSFTKKELRGWFEKDKETVQHCKNVHL